MKEFLATLLCMPVLVLVFAGVLGTSVTVNNPPRFTLDNREQIEVVDLSNRKSNSKIGKPVKLYNSVTGLEIETHERSGNLVREVYGDESLGDLIERINREAEKPVNNPGNLRGADGEFQKFRTPKEGYQALVKDIKIKLSGDSRMMKAKLGENYKPTIKNIIKVYAPPSENDTSHYINFISKHSKINPNKVLSVSDAKRIVPHMIVMEKGHKEAKIYQQYASK